MSHDAAPAIARAGRGLARHCKQMRNAIEWRTARALRGEAPWSTIRLGQRYHAVSLSEYHYLRDGNPETHESALIRADAPAAGWRSSTSTRQSRALFSTRGRPPRRAVEGIVHAFEPTPSTRDLLESNLAANGLGRVRVFPTALGERPGTARLRVHREMSGLNTLASDDITWNHRTLRADAIVDVPVTTLDAHAEAEGIDRIDFLKVDVEGFELGVIRGARGLLGARRVDRIMLEIGDVTCGNAGVAPGDLLTELESAPGYAWNAIYSRRREIADRVRTFPRRTFSAQLHRHPLLRSAR